MLDSSIRRTIQGLLLEIERSLGKLAENSSVEHFDAGAFLDQFERFIALRNALYEVHVVKDFIMGKPNQAFEVDKKITEHHLRRIYGISGSCASHSGRGQAGKRRDGAYICVAHPADMVQAGL